MSMTAEPRVRALRGATTVTGDAPDAIVAATGELLRAMLDRNGLGTDDVVSLIFTSTPDLTSEFPAAGARAIGLSQVPLLCAAEIAVPDGLALCIRVLMHAYTTAAPGSLHHVYLGGASVLRADLSG